jgi:hypothetical protein
VLVNTRRAVVLLREVASLDEEAARLAHERALRLRALAEALEDPEESVSTAPARRRPRGRGVLLLPPTQAPSEIDQQRARKALRKVRDR